MARHVILSSGFVRIVRLRLTITIALFPSYDGTIGFSIHTIDDTIGISNHLNIPTQDPAGGAGRGARDDGGGAATPRAFLIVPGVR